MEQLATLTEFASKTEECRRLTGIDAPASFVPIHGDRAMPAVIFIEALSCGCLAFGWEIEARDRG